jgi:hypothetical protein
MINPVIITIRNEKKYIYIYIYVSACVCVRACVCVCVRLSVIMNIIIINIIYKIIPNSFQRIHCKIKSILIAETFSRPVKISLNHEIIA